MRKLPVGFPRAGGVLLGRNTGTNNLFSMEHQDRVVHMHVLGASRKGKSNFLEVMARQDILATGDVPRGMTFIDPHGSTVQSLIAWIADHRLYRYCPVRILDPGDPNFAFSFNPFRSAPGFETSALVDLLVNATVQVWGGQDITQTPRLRTVLTELYYALATSGLTLLEAGDFLRHEDPKGLRRHFVTRLPSEESRAFWEDLEQLSAARRHEYLESTASRLRPFLKSPFVRRIFGQTERTIDIAAELDRGSVILVNLKPGPYLSPESARLLGALLVTEYFSACFRRKNVRLQHFLYLDECQRFLSQDIARILDESRKFGLSMILSHQHLSHLREAGDNIFRSVMTNTNAKVVFGGLDPDDAEYMARIMFRGAFDLQRTKRRLSPMSAVGNEKVRLEQESRTSSTGTTAGRTWSRGTSTSESAATTTSRSRTKSKARSHSDNTSTTHTDSFSRSHTDSWSESHANTTSTALIDTSSDVASSSESMTSTPAEFFIPGDVLAVSEGSSSGSSHSTGIVTSSGSSDTSTTGGSDSETIGVSTSSTQGHADSETRGIAITRGTAVTKGSSTGVSSEQGGSEATTLGRAESHGSSEAYVTRYERVPGPVWSLEEQVHVRSVSLAQLPVGQAWVRVGNMRAQRVMLPYLGDTGALPERIERIRRQLLVATPYVAPATQVEAEYRAYRERLETGASESEAAEVPVEPDDYRE